MLKAVDLDAVGAGQFFGGLGRLVTADTGMQPVADDFAVHDVGDLEAAKLEAVDCGLQFTLHRCWHAKTSPSCVAADIISTVMAFPRLT